MNMKLQEGMTKEIQSTNLLAVSTNLKLQIIVLKNGVGLIH
jgi:hypothetical protein